MPPPAPQSAPQPVELVPELVPFISAHDRLRIRDEYMTAPDYKALATSLMLTSFVSGQPSQEAADRAAMEACEKVNGPPRTTGPQMQRVCDLYASGNAVVTRRNRPPMPPTPWVVHNATTERPFAAADLPMVPPVSRERAAKNYQSYPRSKTYVISTTGTPYLTYGQSSPEDVVRRTLERCGYESGAPCMVVAIDDAFVIPVPTLAKAVGFYRPDSLTAVSPRLRDEIARRLANATDGWNAVAVGAGGQIGIKVGAGSEQSAVDGARQDCAARDRDCHVIVIGPFLVEATSQDQPQRRGQDQGQGQPQAPASPEELSTDILR
jgi:adenylate cyclase